MVFVAGAPLPKYDSPLGFLSVTVCSPILPVLTPILLVGGANGLPSYTFLGLFVVLRLSTLLTYDKR